MSVEEEKKDYSGLKIGTLKIEDKERALKSSSCIYFVFAMDASCRIYWDRFTFTSQM